jgi:hypothetical protein
VLVALTPEVVRYIYGPKWAPALVALYILYGNMLVSIGTGVLMPAVYSMGWAATGLKISVLWTLITWLAAIGFAMAGVGFEGIAIAYLIGTSVALILIGLRVNSIGRIDAGKPVAIAVLNGVLLALVTRWTGGFVSNWWHLIALGLLSSIVGIIANVWPERQKALSALRRSVGRFPGEGSVPPAVG